MSLVLAIEISNPSAWTPAAPCFPGVAVGRVSGTAATCIASEAIDPTKAHDDDLMTAIDRLFARNVLKPTDISRIAVSVGPGGFTATRIAVTVAKCLAEVCRADAIAVPSAFVAFAAVEKQAGETLILLAAKGETFYCARYSSSGQLLASPAVLSSPEVDLSGVSLVVADRFAPESLRVRAANAQVPICEPVFDPCVLLAIQHGFPVTDLVDIAPLYPREPEAVTKWRELKRAGKK